MKMIIHIIIAFCCFGVSVNAYSQIDTFSVESLKADFDYFAEDYGKYRDLSNPSSLPGDHFTVNLHTLIDGSCGSTNRHSCALLKYHKPGKLI
jgi:hypothetical protein